VGYAVPIAVAAAVAEDLLAFGRVRRAWLGVEGTDLAGPVAEKLGVEGGATVSLVKSGSPAGNGGLREGDVITAIASVPTRSMGEVQRSLSTHRPGQRVSITVLRDRQPLELTVTLAEAPN
jgi:S1-C subfamily serine protease